jgi:hypothetical protein
MTIVYMDPSIPQGKNIVLDYTPADFFYLSLTMPSDNTCQEYTLNAPDCSTASSDGTNISQCKSQALCQNKALVEQVYSKQNVHSGTDVKWRDLNAQYSVEMQKTANLLIGLVVSGVFIYYNRPG